MVHREQAEQVVVVLGDGLSGPVLVRRPRLRTPRSTARTALDAPVGIGSPGPARGRAWSNLAPDPVIDPWFGTQLAEVTRCILHPVPVSAASPTSACCRPADLTVAGTRRLHLRASRAPSFRRAARGACLHLGRSPCRRCRPSALASAPPVCGRGRRCCRSSTCRCRPTSSTAPSTSTASACPDGFTHDRALAEVRRARRGVRVDRAARAGRGADHGRSRSVFGLHELAVEDAVHAAPAAQARALRRHAVHGAQDRPLLRRAVQPGGRRDRGGHGLRRPRLRDHASGTATTPGCTTCAAAWRPTPSSSRSGRPRCCTRSRTTSSTTTWPSPKRSRTTSTSSRREVFTPPFRAGRRADLRDEARGARAAPGGGRRWAAPLRKLTEGYSALVPHEVRSYFRDVDDHLVTVTERIGSFNELLTYARRRRTWRRSRCSRTAT